MFKVSNLTVGNTFNHTNVTHNSECNSWSAAGTCCVAESNGWSKSSVSVATKFQEGDACQSLASLQEMGDEPVRLHFNLMHDFLFFCQCTAIVCMQQKKSTRQLSDVYYSMPSDNKSVLQFLSDLWDTDNLQGEKRAY